MRRSHLAAAMAGMALGALGIARGVSVTAQQRPEMRDMQLVGYHDLQARSGYQPVIHKQGDRWIAYVGHHGDRRPNPVSGRIEDNGTSIVDVTDPARPRYLAHIPGEEGKAEQGGAQMVRICPGATLPRADPSKFYMLRVFGNQAHVRGLGARGAGRHLGTSGERGQAERSEQCAHRVSSWKAAASGGARLARTVATGAAKGQRAKRPSG